MNIIKDIDDKVEGMYTTEDCDPFFYCGIFLPQAIFYFCRTDSGHKTYFVIERPTPQEIKSTKEHLLDPSYKNIPFQIKPNELPVEKLYKLLGEKEKFTVEIDELSPPKDLEFLIQIQKQIQDRVGKAGKIPKISHIIHFGFFLLSSTFICWTGSCFCSAGFC